MGASRDRERGVAPYVEFAYGGDAMPSLTELRYLTRREAAELARVSVNTIDRARRKRELRFSGGHGLAVRIRPVWVVEWLERRSPPD
jgi:hypothetical protein